MNYVILGGEGLEQQQWVCSVADAVRPLDGKVTHLDYRHWEAAVDSPEPTNKPKHIDLKHEIEKAGKLARGFDEYTVIANSIGAVVTTLATARGVLKPEYCYFFGFPLAAINKWLPQVDTALRALPPTIFTQNYRDPDGYYFKVRDYFDAHPPKWYDCRQLAGDKPDYNNFSLIARIISDPTNWTRPGRKPRSRPDR